MATGSDLSKSFSTGAAGAIGVGAGALLWKTVEPTVVEVAKKVDDFITSEPIEKRDVEGKQSLVMTNAEAGVLFGGVAAGVILAPVIIPIGAGTSVCMMLRRMYVNNECKIS